VPLSKYTTLGTGGPAYRLGNPGTVDELVGLLAWAREEDLPVAAVGLGSNLLAADEGYPGLVLKLGGQLASAHVADGVLRAGGGAPLAVCLHRAREAELGGLEFVCAIPGTVGGGVKMNAGAYGGDVASVLVRAQVAGVDGAEWRSPEQLGLSYRRSTLGPGEVVAAAEFRGVGRPVAEIKACGLRGFAIGGAQISPKHANFIENAGEARSADAVALIAEARRRAREQFGVTLEPEVQLVGAIEIPPLR
jgi:UDP-N-acetylmuramate dehydrogenase